MSAAVPLSGLFAAEDWLILLDVSLTGIQLLRPVYGPAGDNIVDFAIEYLNPAGQRMTGLVEQPGGTLLGRFPHALTEGIFQYYQRVFETGETLAYEVNYQADGLDNYFKFSARRSGPHLLVSFTDTSDQDRSPVELALRQSQATEQTARAEAAAQRLVQERDTFYQVFAQTPAAICIQRGPEHRYEYVNQAYRDFFPGRPLLGQPVAEALPETVASGVVALLDRVYQTGETYNGVELPLLVAQPQGPPKQMYFTFTYQAYREQGEIVGISTFAYDVAEQVRARQQREAQQEQLRELFEQAPVAIAVFEGPDYVVEVANPRVAELWGRTPAQVMGLPLFEALPEVDPAFRPLLDRVVQTGEAYAAQEVATPLLRAGGVETVYLNFVYEPLRDATGAITRVAAVATDVTGQVQDRLRVQELNNALHASNAELAGTNAQLVRTNVDLDTFIYTASHDLKAPITNIEGLLYALRSELPAQNPSGEVAYILDLMQDSVERFTRTIAHLTDVSKLQKTFEEPARPVQLAAIMEDVRLDLAPLLHATGGHLDVDVRAVPTVTFAEKNLRSVLFNLLNNALKYRYPDRVPKVRVRAWLDGAYAVLEVQDNGLGLDLAQGQEKLFGMFQRLHTHVEGSGVGLYMVKRLVENAGGHLTVSSTLGEGTTFAVYLPR